MAASATFALKAGLCVRRARRVIVTPDMRHSRRSQADFPLIGLSEFAQPPLTIRTPNRCCPGRVSAGHAEAENYRAVKRFARLQFGGRIIRMVWTIGIMLRLQRDGVRLTIDAADAGEIAFHEIARIDLDARLVRQALQPPSAGGID